MEATPESAPTPARALDDKNDSESAVHEHHRSRIACDVHARTRQGAARRSCTGTVEGTVVTTPAVPVALDAPTLDLAAAAVLPDAFAQATVLHLPGRRDDHRDKLARSIELARSALATAEGAAPETIAGARSTLVKAHAARARDARHGAGQLSLGAQRAPTCEACDDGWQRVEEIVAVAEASALEAKRMAAELDTTSAWTAAQAAEAAARDARRIVDERNHAYTFHADPGFSFGEGWYLAAAI